MPGTFFQGITAQQADVSQPWANSLEFYITPWGFLKGAAANNATVEQKESRRQELHRPDVEPDGQGGFRQELRHQWLRDDKNIVDRVETWLGDNIMGDMHILAIYSGWKDFGGVMAPAKIVQTRGGWPFFEVNVTAAKANPADVATLVPAPRRRAAVAVVAVAAVLRLLWSSLPKSSATASTGSPPDPAVTIR